MLLQVSLLGEALSEILTAYKLYKCQRWFSTEAELNTGTGLVLQHKNITLSHSFSQNVPSVRF